MLFCRSNAVNPVSTVNQLPTNTILHTFHYLIIATRGFACLQQRMIISPFQLPMHITTLHLPVTPHYQLMVNQCSSFW